MKTLVFSITKKDLRMDSFYAGGPGGQNQNKRKTGIRWTHIPSGATGESREHRTQLENKRTAFKHLGEDPKLKLWIYSQLLMMDNLDKKVDQALKDIKIDIKQDGRWVTVTEDYFKE